ncbi:TetR/AcrR family transcriptional regulator [Nocardia sp. BMG111209]|uniref:TetR/AcrR family transcriptional regulator n=1 Tax=Nocardia sp. BMG111209 TaxID=1160137 RepID=UPI0003802773|nr:TetR/AcrR family transcriptional regulator [Nocardia sp. BMG111209]
MSETGGKSQAAVDGRATRWEDHKRQRRTEVLDAALEVIEECGAEVSVQQIADRLGLPRPVVYRHFDGRTDLDEQIRRRIQESLLDEVMPMLRTEGSVRDAVRGAVGTYVGWVERHRNLHLFLTGDAADGDGSHGLGGARNRIGGRLADLFATALSVYDIDPHRARPMAFGVIGLVDGVVDSWRGDPATLTSDQVVGMLTESILGLFEGNARSLGVPLTRDTPVADLLSRRVVPHPA